MPIIAPLFEEQNQIVFFYEGDEPPSEEMRLSILDRTNLMSPYYGIVGNSQAIEQLIRLDFHAMGNYNHDASKINVAIFGGAGIGKSNIAKRHCFANQLPTIEISPKAVNRVHDVYLAIQQGCEENYVPLVPIGGKEDNLLAPPCNVFFDEMQAVPKQVQQGMLKPTEKKDGIMVTEEKVRLDCRHVHWVCATTDRGQLGDAFDTRFMGIHLCYYKKDEIAQIVKNNHPKIPMEACKLVAHYAGKIPREALDFAVLMDLQKDMRRNSTWEDAAHKIANEKGIDEFGMTKQRLRLIEALAKGSIASARLSNHLPGCRLDEINRFILPWLMEATEEQEPLVGVGQRGYFLTDAGKAELAKRHTKEAA